MLSIYKYMCIYAENHTHMHNSTYTHIHVPFDKLKLPRYLLLNTRKCKDSCIQCLDLDVSRHFRNISNAEPICSPKPDFYSLFHLLH